MAGVDGSVQTSGTSKRKPLDLVPKTQEGWNIRLYRTGKDTGTQFARIAGPAFSPAAFRPREQRTVPRGNRIDVRRRRAEFLRLF